jgi:hypothetical protein
VIRSALYVLLTNAPLLFFQQVRRQCNYDRSITFRIATHHQLIATMLHPLTDYLIPTTPLYFATWNAAVIPFRNLTKFCNIMVRRFLGGLAARLRHTSARRRHVDSVVGTSPPTFRYRYTVVLTFLKARTGEPSSSTHHLSISSLFPGLVLQ